MQNNLVQSLYLQHSVPETSLFAAVYAQGQIKLSDKVIDITALCDTGALHFSYVAQRIVNANKAAFLPYLSKHDGVVRLADGTTLVPTKEKASVPIIFFGKDGKQHFGKVDLVVFPHMGNNEMILGLPDIIRSFSKLHIEMIQDAVDNLVSNQQSVNTVGEPPPPPEPPPLITNPWSQSVLDSEAIEDLETPLPCSFPDALHFMEKSYEDAVAEYISQIADHVHPAFAKETDIVNFLKKVAVKVFIPQEWTGINGIEPFELEWTDGLPDSIKPKARPVNPKLFENAKREFERLCTYFYRPSTSPIASCLVIAPKATFPFIRFCGDYVLINKYIVMGHFPMPNVLHVLEKISMFAVFLDIALATAFHQLRLGPITSSRLSVQTPWGQVEPIMMPEGIKPAPGKLNIVVWDIFGDFSDWIICIHDNLLVLAHDYKDAFEKFKLVVQRCIDRNVVLKFSKTWLGFPEVKFFGYVCSRHSYRLADDRKQTLMSVPFPKTMKQMQSFLGAALFFKNFIPHFSSLTAQLHDMVHKTFNWDSTTWKIDYKQVFENLKSHLLGANALYFPDYNLDWILRTDASTHGIGAVLLQVFIASDGTEILQPISYVSKKFSDQARNWSTIEQEAYAIYYAVNHFAYYLRCKHFILETDHNNLLWMEASQVPKIVRWRVLLQSFSFSLRHIAGSKNTVADWLSRIHEYCETTVANIVLNSLFDGREESALPSTVKDVNSLLATVHSGRNLHPGVRRTWLALNETYPGHRIPYKVVEEFVMTCPICQKDRLAMTDSIQPIVRHLKPPHARSIVGVDTLTVTPTDQRGNTVILVVINLFTKLVGLYPAPKHDALNTAIALFQYFCTFGLVDGIISDPGTEFTNELIAHLTRWLGIRHTFSLVDRHESNGTEPTNKAILRHLKALVYEERLVHQWSDPTVLPLIQFVLNSSYHSESGASAFQLTYGSLDSIYFDLAKLERKENDSMHDDTHAFIKLLDSNLQFIRQKSLEYQEQLAKDRTADTPEETQNVYQEGDRVLFKRDIGMKPTKLSPRYIGPYVVIKQYKNDVTCKHIIMGNIETLHVSRLKPFFGDLDAAKRMAMIDHDQYEVDQFLAHRGDPYTRTTMEFEIRFKDGEVKWLTFSEDLFQTVPYEEYCRSKPELQLLLYRAKVATDMIKKWNSTAIVDVKPNDEYFVDLRCYGATWYSSLTIPDKDHITYVVLYKYMSFKNKNHTKIEVACPIFDEVFTVSNDFIKLYGSNKTLIPDGLKVVLVDATFVKQFPQVLPTTS